MTSQPDTNLLFNQFVDTHPSFMKTWSLQQRHAFRRLCDNVKIKEFFDNFLQWYNTTHSIPIAKECIGRFDECASDDGCECVAYCIMAANNFRTPALAPAYDVKCEHKRMISSDPGESYSAAVCADCGERMFGWYCPKSPDGRCHYSKSFDSCDYCEYPEERK